MVTQNDVSVKEADHVPNANVCVGSLEDARELIRRGKDLEKAHKKRIRDAAKTADVAVLQLKKQLKAAQTAAKKRKAEKELETLSGPNATGDASSATPTRLEATRARGKYARLDKWQLGNRYARQERQKWLKLITVDSLAEVLPCIQKYGICIVNQMQNFFHADCKPDKQQRDYILSVPEADTLSLFEGAIYTDTLGYTALHWPNDSKVGKRVQLKAAGHSGKWGPLYVQYKNKYMSQLSTIIKGIFPDTMPASNPANWKMDFNSVVGGQGYQHPHSDQGRPGCYKHLDVFPFVALHGFGMDEFALWLLPPNAEYGFLNRFEPHQIVFMRGDQVHAGVPSTTPRGHMEFYPLPAAGYHRHHPYWVRPGYKQEIFALQDTTIFPFGYPDITPADAKGQQYLRYPEQVTKLMQLPLPEEPDRGHNKRDRAAMKKRMYAQLELY